MKTEDQQHPTDLLLEPELAQLDQIMRRRGVEDIFGITRKIIRMAFEFGRVHGVREAKEIVEGMVSGPRP